MTTTSRDPSGDLGVSRVRPGRSGLPLAPLEDVAVNWTKEARADAGKIAREGRMFPSDASAVVYASIPRGDPTLVSLSANPQLRPLVPPPE